MQRNNLHCIDLDMPAVEGFRKFISCWLYRSAELTFVIDPGPLSTLPHLLAELRRYQVERLDYILLTHIHIDHAGGTGELLKNFPRAKVICHPQGIKHLIDPAQLWLGSQKVLGELAACYGEIIPVPAANIDFAEEIGASGIRSFLTPGHAQHHCCYLFADLLFGGEVAGVHAKVSNGIYMRPATPPRFILEVAVDSLERMLALQPKALVIAHYGLVEPAVDYLQIALQQLKLWVKGVAQDPDLTDEASSERIYQWLLSHDHNFNNIHQLDADIRTRERYFLNNSLRGMSDYVSNLSPAARQQLSQG